MRDTTAMDNDPPPEILKFDELCRTDSVFATYNQCVQNGVPMGHALKALAVTLHTMLQHATKQWTKCDGIRPRRISANGQTYRWDAPDHLVPIDVLDDLTES